MFSKLDSRPPLVRGSSLIDESVVLRPKGQDGTPINEVMKENWFSFCLFTLKWIDDLTSHDFMFMFISQLIDSAAIRLSCLYIRHWIRTCYINSFLILVFFWFRLLHLHCCHNFLIIASNLWALVFLRYFITSFGHFECLIHIGHISESRISNCISLIMKRPDSKPCRFGNWI